MAMAMVVVVVMIMVMMMLIIMVAGRQVTHADFRALNSNHFLMDVNSTINA